jgi:hypothetical protein
MNTAQRVAIAGLVVVLFLGFAFYFVPFAAGHVGVRRSGTLPWWAIALIVAYSLLSTAVTLFVIARRRRKRLR